MLTNHELADLRARAAPVTQSCQLRHPPGLPKLSARGAASALSGVIHLVTSQQGLSAMQAACAKLARWDWGAWSDGNLGATPPGDGGLRILAAVAAGVALVAGVENTVAALAFWACETDPAVWRHVAAAA